MSDTGVGVKDAQEGTEGPVERIAAVLRGQLDLEDYRGDQLFEGAIDPDDLAAAIWQSMMSWDFLLALLDEHYPEDVFPTMEDRESRDPGPRIVSLIRHLNQARR